ncbi:MAG: hypothetical protein AB7O76_20605 [Rhizobiaceae bacterium]
MARLMGQTERNFNPRQRRFGGGVIAAAIASLYVPFWPAQISMGR